MFKRKPILHRITFGASVVAVSSMMIVGAAVTADAAVAPGTPKGDFVVRAEAGGIRVMGWAWDPDTTNPVTLTAAIDGSPTSFQATLPRPDVARAFPRAGAYRGFNVLIPAAPGTHNVCAIAANVGPGSAKAFTCKTAVVVDHDPAGALDPAASQPDGLRIRGWAADADTTAPVSVQLTVTGTASTQTTLADQVSAGQAGAHRYDAFIKLAPGAYEVCAKALNSGFGKDAALGCSSANVPVPAPVVPGASSTGVPAGTQLTVHEGDLTITTPGAVVDSVDVHGYLRIKAPNVTVKNSIVRGRAGLIGSMSLVQNSSAGVVIQDSELVAAYPTYYVDGFVGNNTTFTRVNIHGVVDSIKLTGDNVVVQDSWLHDNLYYASVPSGGDTHSDNVQIQQGQNITVRNNVMTGTHNAVVMVTQDRGHVGNLLITGNKVDNGACTINIAEKTYGPIEGLTITDNVFGTGQRLARCAIVIKPMTSSISTITGNTFTDLYPFALTRG